MVCCLVVSLIDWPFRVSIGDFIEGLFGAIFLVQDIPIFLQFFQNCIKLCFPITVGVGRNRTYF